MPRGPDVRSRRRGAPMAIALLLLIAACGTDDPELVNLDASPTAGEETATTSTDDPTPDASVGETDGAETPDEPTPDTEITTDPDATPEPTFEPSGDPAFSSSSKLTTVGLDTVFFGMTPDEAARAADTAWFGLPKPGTAERCFTIGPEGGPRGVRFTVFDGHIERVDITNPDLRTRSGFGVGTTEAELVDALGDQLEVTEVDGGRRAVFVPVDESDADLRIVWLLEGGATTRMWAGRVPQVDPLEPCG